MNDIKLGDEVRVFIGRRHHVNPEDGYRGVVTRAGRKYGTATYDVTSDHRTWTSVVEFDLETGRVRGSSSSYSTRVRTPGQVAEDQRREAALAALAEAGVSFESFREHSLTVEQIEALAEVVKDWED